MSRIPWTDEQERFIFERDGKCCRKCGKPLVFGNRQKGQPGAWHMGHKRAIADGGSNHLKNMIALCIPCNREQGTTSFADEERKMNYNSNVDSAKNFFNQKFGASFDLRGARRSRTMESNLDEFEQKIKKMDFIKIKEYYKKYYPIAARYEGGQSTKRNPGDEIYLHKVLIMRDYVWSKYDIDLYEL